MTNIEYKIKTSSIHHPHHKNTPYFFFFFLTPPHQHTAIGAGLSPGLVDTDEAQRQFPAPSTCCWQAGDTQSSALKTPRSPSPSPSQRACMPLICKSLKSMTNVHWKFLSVPLESICKSLIQTPPSPPSIHSCIVLTRHTAWL